MAAQGEDRFANHATIELTMSAANTISFQELITGVGIFAQQSKGMLVDEINYFIPNAVLAEMTSIGDQVTMALCTSNNPTDLEDLTDRRILDNFVLSLRVFGTPANAIWVQQPRIHQFFPALITAEQKLYLGANTTGLASAAKLRLRLRFRFIDLTDKLAMELLQTFRLVS